MGHFYDPCLTPRLHSGAMFERYGTKWTRNYYITFIEAEGDGPRWESSIQVVQVFVVRAHLEITHSDPLEQLPKREVSRRETINQIAIA